MSIRTGETLGGFTILGLIGKGGMGEVYLARDSRLGRDVALKLLPSPVARAEQWRQRFLREARLLASLNHPSIAALYDIREHDDALFLVMELVEGETLAERLRRGPMLLRDAISVFHQMAEGLAHAHARHIIHRDLKPGNLKFAAAGRIKIIDFGIARSIDAAGIDPSAPHGDITQSGVVIGTPAYMSPEQTTASPLDHRTDIWSFGCCLFEALTGERLYSADHPLGLVAKVVSDEPEWRRLPATTPPEIRNLLMSCLLIDPRQRLSDISLAAATLRGLLQSCDTPAPPTSPPPRRSRFSVLLALSIAPVPASPPESPTNPPALDPDRATEIHPAVVAALRRFDGTELAHRDGRFLLAFELPSRALLFALAIQRQIAGMDDPPLAAAIGIHTGEIQNEGEEEAELDPAKARGAVRGTLALMQLAVSHQILISEAAYPNARDRFDDAPFGEQTTWLDHGVYDIEGLSRPMRIHEAGLIGISRLKPPPPTTSARLRPDRRPLGVSALSRRPA